MLYYNKSINWKIHKSKNQKIKKSKIKKNKYCEKVFKDIAQI